MVKSSGCPACELKLSQIQQIYQRRLNSLADTFLSLLNNIENNSLFKDFQKVQIIENRKEIQLKQLKQKVSSFRIEFLQSVIEGVINENRENTVKKLQMQNANLRNENIYFQKIIQYHQLSYRDFHPQNFYEDQNFNEGPLCQSEYQEEQNYEQNRKSKSGQTKQKFFKPKANDLVKEIHKSKLFFKFSSENSIEQAKAYETPDSTSFVVNLKENGSEDLSNNCISSIDPVSETSSFPSSQKSFIKGKTNVRKNPDNEIFTVSLREQLSSLNSNSKRIENQAYSESRRKRQIKKIVQDEQNEENIEPKQYQFKYLKF